MELNIKCRTYYELFNYVHPKFYLQCLQKAQQQALLSIQEKYGAGNKIRIAFEVVLLSTWIGDDIVHQFLQDDRFDVTVVITWQENLDFEHDIPQLIEHFKKSKIPFIFADGNISPKDFDIILYTSPYLQALHNWKDFDVPLSTLVCYVPYGFYAAKLQANQFNLFIHNITWKKYALSKGEFPLTEHYCNIGTHGLIYSGYPKLDPLAQPEKLLPVVWKKADPQARPLKIIYAPHHSINEPPYHSTFPQNYQWMLEYAKSHPTTTSWVFKPHPVLRVSCIRNGIFSSMEEFEQYCEAWNRLPNAQTVEGEYMPWFASSDCMILDSLSFLSEYLYVDRPCLYLTRGSTAFNEMGELIFEAWCQTKGNDYEGIRQFLEKTVYEDPKKEYRRNVFTALLDYFGDNHMTATEFIYHDIVDSLFETQ